MPTYTENHVLLAWGGDAYEQQEEWSNSTRLKHIGGDAGPAMQADVLASLDDVEAAVRAYYSDPQARYAFNTRLTWIRMNVISAATGRYLYPNDPVLVEVDPPLASTSSTGVPQVAYCVTLRSGIRRGPAARGRWYVPTAMESPPVTSTGVLPAAGCVERAEAASRFLEALQDISIGAGPNTWSPWLYGSGINGDADAAVQTVSVGNVLDTQRRRREQIAETYFDGGYDPV